MIHPDAGNSSGTPAKGRLPHPALLAALLLVLLVALVGRGMWRKASRAIMPPHVDAGEYHQKAAACWQTIKGGWEKSLLDVEPVTRPPGTLLLSHPFGFSPDFRGFLFRSVFVPLVIVAASLWALLRGDPALREHPWACLAAVLAVAGLPLFHHLERTDHVKSPTFWGLVDTFEASLAVLAVVLIVISVRRLSMALFIAGAAVSAFMLLVKPAGLFLMPLVLWHWGAETLAAHGPLRAAWRGSRRLRVYALAAVPLFTAVCAAVALRCLHSAYLNDDAFRYFRGAVKIYGDRVAGVIPQIVLRDLHTAIGWHWAVVLAIAIVAGIVALARRLRRGGGGLQPEHVRFAAALAALCAGVCWWLLLAGPLFRYFEPFLLVFIAVLLPDAVKTVLRFPPRARMSVTAACCAPFLLILPLHLTRNPPAAIQRALGVNLATGQYAAEIAMCRHLTAEAAKANRRDLRVYGIAQTPRQSMLADAAYGFALVDGIPPAFHLTFNLDWERPTMVRRREIAAADFILFHPAAPGVIAERLAQRTARDFREEELIIEAWLTQAGEAEGIAPTGMESVGIRLVRIMDRVKFDAAFGRLVAAHEWRPLFLQENAW